jgi:uncharacterized protein (TIGR03437 family)
LILLSFVTGTFAQLPNVNVNTKQLNFVHTIGSNVGVPTQTVQVISEPARVFSVTTQLTNPTNVSNWLRVNAATSTTGTTGQASSFVTVSADPTGLPVGVYQGRVRVELIGGTVNDIDVYLRVSTLPQIALNVPAVNIQGQAGSTVSVIVPIASTGAAVPYQATVTQYYGASNWLSVTPTTSNTGPVGFPAQVTLTANLASVPAGLHYAVVNFRNTSGTENGDVSLPVILTVTQVVQVSANPSPLNFAFQASNLSATTSVRALNVSASANSPLAYTATVDNASRLLLSKTAVGQGAATVAGTTPENIYVIVNPVGIAAGQTAAGNVTISTSNNSVTVPVNISVTNQPLLVSAVDNIGFTYALGGTRPVSQFINLTATSGVLNFAATEAEVSGGDWLTVSTNNNSTPSIVTVSVNETRLQQLAAGTYTANITLTPAGGGIPLTIPVTLTVTGTASTLIVATADNTNTLTFAAPVNGTVPGTQTITVASTDNTNQAFTVSIDPATAASWLVVPTRTGQTGNTGTFFTVGVSPSGVTQAGRYEADIVVTPQTAAGTAAVPQRVHVVFNASATLSITADPARVEVTQTGTTPPAPVTVNVTSAVQGVRFTTTSDATWVTVDPVEGNLGASTPFRLTFNSANLAVGRHEAVVRILPSGANELRIPVTLIVQSAAQLTISQTAFPVTYVQGSGAPTNLTVNLTSSGTPINFTATAASTGNWLSVEPASGTTNASTGAPTPLTLRINPAGLTPGTQTGTVTIAAANSSLPPQTVTVTLTVTAPTPPLVSSVENAGSNLQTFIAPGTLIAIKGTNLGPAAQAFGNPVNGAYPTTLSDVRVLFDGIPAPIIYASNTQINVVAPYSVFGRLSTRLVVEYRGVASTAVEYRVTDASPAIFTQNSTGRGAGSILNQNMSVNTVNNPARRGEVIVIYANGAGAMTPSLVDGRVVSGTVESLPRPAGRVTVRINGQDVGPADILYAGAAPGLIAGVLQVNVRVPANLNITGPAQVPIEIGVGGVASQQGVTVSVIP